jgi:RND family efflux transporter MFP subunit
VASYFGTLQPSRRARLAFGVPGKVALVSKSVGEEVKAGEIIAQFDIVRLESDRQRVSGLLESAQASQTQQPTTRLSDLEDQLAKLELQIENSILVAPFSGTLSRLDVWAGQMTGPGNVLAEVVSDSPPVVEVSIAAKTAQAQFVGRQLEVVMEDSVTAEAVIKSVATLVDRSTRTRRVMLEITSDLSSVTYTFGGIVKVSFDSFRQATGFWLPLSAMQKRAGGLWSTMVLESVGDRTIAGLRAIEVVYVENDTAYVTGALKDGDLVIADGTHRIVPGQNVVAVPENGKGSSALDTPDRLERSSP